MASTSASNPTVSSPIRALESVDSVNSTFVFPAGNHSRSQSTIAHSKSPNEFVFPRRPPSMSSIGSQARPRSSVTDASALLAEIGVLPPSTAASGNRSRNPSNSQHAAGSRPQSMVVTPPMSSGALAPAPGGRIGHRRGASELIGGEKLFDTDKSDSAGDKKPVASGASGGVGSRRGHAHRRSGAISSGDILGLISQSTPSLPLPPSPQKDKENTESQKQDGADAKSSPVTSWSAPVSPDFGSAPLSLSSLSSTIPFDSSMVFRRSNRVAFTDRVEIIPRPLSTSSIGSGLTVTGHHGADSISSLGSFGSSISKSPSTAPVSRSPTRSRSNSISTQTNPLSPELLQEITQRPSTAGAILSSPKTRARPNELLPLSTTPSSLDPSSTDSEGSCKSRASSKKHKKALSDSSPHSSPSSPSAGASEIGVPKTKSKNSKKLGKRKKKQIKSWLGARLVGVKNDKNRGTTLPKAGDDITDWRLREEPTPGWAQSYVLMPEGSMAGRSLEELSSTMSPRLNNYSAGSSPVIDLDAALAPLNSPSPASGGKVTGFSAAKRTMHSSGASGRLSVGAGIGSGIGGNLFGASFIGSHRRSESMPEMPLFTLSEEDRMIMEDVFEEDEDEEDEDTDSDESEDEIGNDSANTEGLGIGIKVVDMEGITTWEESVNMDFNSRLPAPTLSAGNGRRGSLAPSLSKGSLRNESIIEEDETDESALDAGKAVTPSTSFDKLRYVCDNSSSRCVTPTSPQQSSQSSTSTVTASNPTPASPQLEIFDTRPRSSSLATSTYTGTESPSSAPSTPNLGPIHGGSYPTPTIKELVAEIAAQDRFDPYADSPLRFLGEPGPEMRMSVDDVPSLTSSRSTMTSSYAAYCLASQPPTPLREEMNVGANKKSKSGKKKWVKVFKFWEGKKKDKEKKEEKKGKEKEKEKEKSSPPTKATSVINSSVPSLHQ